MSLDPRKIARILSENIKENNGFLFEEDGTPDFLPSGDLEDWISRGHPERVGESYFIIEIILEPKDFDTATRVDLSKQVTAYMYAPTLQDGKNYSLRLAREEQRSIEVICNKKGLDIEDFRDYKLIAKLYEVKPNKISIEHLTVDSTLI